MPQTQTSLQSVAKYVVALLGLVAAATNLFPQSIVTNLPLTTTGYSVTVNELLNKIYVSGGFDAGLNVPRNIVVVDGNTNTKTTIEVGGCGSETGSGVSVDQTNNQYWAGDLYCETVTVRNGTNDAIVATISLSGCPGLVDIDPVHRHAWVATQCVPGNDPYYCLDADTFANLSGPIGTGGVGGGLLVNPVTGRCYLPTDGNFPPSDTISRRINPLTFAITTNTFKFPAGVNPINGLMYAGSVTAPSPQLQVIDGKPDPEIVLTNVALPFLPYGGFHIGVNPTLNRLYIKDIYQSAVLIMDGTTYASMGVVALSGSDSPVDISVDSIREMVYVVAFSTNVFPLSPSYNVPSLYVIHDGTSPLSAPGANSWTNNTDGKWEAGRAWSLGLPPNNKQSAILITNANPKTVTIDTTTSGSFPATMTISNLTVSAPNTVSLFNPGFKIPLRILNAFLIEDGGALTATGAALAVESKAGGGCVINGQMVVDSGIFAVPATAIILGQTSGGSLTVRNSLLQAQGLFVGFTAPTQSSLLIDGGTNSLNGGLYVGYGLGVAGAVTMTTGQLLINGGMYLGSGGTGTMTVSNGSVQALRILVGGVPGSQGTLSIAGGNMQAQALTLGLNQAATGTVWVTGGQLLLTNDLGIGNANLAIGGDGFGQMIVSNGTVTVGYMRLGTNSNAEGVLSVFGGTVTVLSDQAGSVRVGDFSYATGTVAVAGGQLFLTNGTTVVGSLGVGHMMVSNGTVLANTIFLGSSAGGQGDLTIQSNGVVSFDSSTAGTNTMLVANDLIIQGGLLQITNGMIYCGQDHPGALLLSNGTVNGSVIYIGDDYNGTLTVAGGQMSVANQLVVGEQGSGTGYVWMTGGTLVATNDATVIGNFGVGQLTVSNGSLSAGRVLVSNGGNPGTLSIQGGSLTGDLAIQPSGRLQFGSGQLTVTATTSSNGHAFVIGNGTQAATMTLQGGTHSFDAGLIVARQSLLTGCGTINGMVVNNGLIAEACAGGTLTFSGVVTNNGQIVAENGVVLNFLGPVVNYGMIEGTANFGMGVSGNGTVATNPPTTTALAVIPSAYDFGSVPTGTTVPISFLLTNTSTTVLYGTANVSGVPFGISGGTPFTLPGLGAANVMASFTPETIGSFTGTVEFASNGGSVTNLLTGNGITSPVLPPMIISGPVVSNAFAQIGNLAVVVVDETNLFSVTATDPAGNPLGYQWQFGDGVTNPVSMQSLAQHIYTTNCDPYQASVTVSNGAAAVTSNLNVAVACELTVTKLQVKLDFARTNSDTATLAATLDPGIESIAAGTTLTVALGGAAETFRLSATGLGTGAGGTCKLAKSKTQGWTLSVALKKGSWHDQLAGYGLQPGPVAKAGVPVSLPVVVVLGDEAFAAERALTYTAPTAKTGSAR